jgi:thioredoxin 1
MATVALTADLLEPASKTHPDIMFGQVDSAAESGLVATARTTSIPTLRAFRDGFLVFSQPGALPAVGLEQIIAEVRGPDLERVRRQVSEQPNSRLDRSVTQS